MQDRSTPANAAADHDMLPMYSSLVIYSSPKNIMSSSDGEERCRADII
jgi:hypothetical protein